MHRKEEEYDQLADSNLAGSAAITVPQLSGLYRTQPSRCATHRLCFNFIVFLIAFYG